MKFEKIIFIRHALTRMFQQYISIELVEKIAAEGEVIKSYADDKPFPSYLCLGFNNIIPVHVVAAFDESEKKCIIVTACIPDSLIWSADFKTKIINK